MHIAIAPASTHTAETLARETLAAALDLNPAEIVFYRGKNGKPQTELPLYFNCSHSGEYVVCAVSEREIGVDIERIRSVHWRVARSLFPKERQWLESLPEPQREEGFLRLWTLKESWIKCCSGVVMEYRRAEFELQGREILSAPEGFAFQFISAPKGYVLAVCERK